MKSWSRSLIATCELFWETSEQEMRISSSGGTLTVNTGSEVIVFVPKVQTAARCRRQWLRRSRLRCSPEQKSGKSVAGNDARVSPFVFQNSMNLPPDKARLLRQYDNEKKWDLICDQVRRRARIRHLSSAKSVPQPGKPTFSILCLSSGALPGQESSSHLHPEATRILGPTSHPQGGGGL